ncbi:hypothetical protein RR46_11570 [Papilio xuthus]|uniref:Ionotropic glutamate receptor C-terminal domain-containing protein n=1 Tax=Papilio xuthus TaxID=66420 RepID=A0A194PRC1_PAPXU|nr:hypothetical protein RR46_11570 [Papilio xuthus]
MLLILTIIALLHPSISIDPDSPLSKEIFTYHNQTSFKAEYAFEVVEKIFNAFKQWFFTITFCDFTYFENRILKYTENNGYGYPVMLLNGCPDANKTKVKPRINRHGATAYLVTSNQLSLDGSEFVIEALMRTGVFKPRSAVIFVINTPVEMDSYFFYTMKLHFRLLLSRSITNSVMVLYCHRLIMYTYNPFNNEIRDVTNVKDVGRLLAQQYNNLFRQELRLSVFRKIFVSNENGPVYCDSRLAETVMKILNATCKPLAPRDANTVGDLLKNGTATGVTADLIDGYTDLELNSRILKNSYYGYIDTTYPLGIITSAIAYPRYKPDINTLSELLQTNLTFAVHNRHLHIYNRSLGGEYYNVIRKRTQIFGDSQIKQAIVKRQFQYAILLRKTDAQFISRQQSNMINGRPLFHTVEECPVPCSIVYGLRYGSPYLPKLNNILHHLNQGGILQYWSKSDEYSLYRTNGKSIYGDENKERKPLSNENVKEIFVVLLIGVSVSLLVFIIEILLNYFAFNFKILKTLIR